MCVLPNRERAKLFRAETGTRKPVQVVWNCPELQEVREPRRQPIETLQLLYHGSVGPALLPISVVHALKHVNQAVVLHVVGYETAGSRGYGEELQRAAAELGIPERLRVHGPLPRRPLMEYCQSCDVGLALLAPMPDNPNMTYLAGASNKVFDYMACGLAVMVPDISSWRHLFVEPGYGLACDPADAISIGKVIGYFCDHLAKVREMGERGRQRIVSEWNYETQFRPVWEVLSKGTVSGTASQADFDQSLDHDRVALP